MTGRLTVERADAVAPDARVRDYDELDPRAQAHLAMAVADGDASPVGPRTAADFEGCDVVNYTDYLRVDVV